MNKKRYQNILDVVSADIEKVNDNLFDDIDLKPKLSKELEKFLKSPSKRIRSLVTILFLRASKMYLLPAHYELLSAVELIHNASLIHDDVIDESEYRRSEKSFNGKFDNKLAVISGDYLLGIVLKKLVKINSSEVIDIFADTVKTMCKGEVNQYYSRFKKEKLEEYIEKSAQKTASLFECALKSAVILADENYTEKMEEFAINFGLAFQIRDDLKNVLEQSKSPNISDVEDGIYNAPLILSDNLADGIEKTNVLLNNYVSCAKQCIEDLPDSIYKTALGGLLELVEDV